jgi:hypothetical protein
MKESGVLLNIDACFKVVRQASALDYMLELREKGAQNPTDWQSDFQNTLAGATVVTG